MLAAALCCCKGTCKRAGSKHGSGYALGGAQQAMLPFRCEEATASWECQAHPSHLAAGQLQELGESGGAAEEAEQQCHSTLAATLLKLKEKRKVASGPRKAG